MQQTARKIHLWIGLILAIFIIIEALTGLILAEPGLVGQGNRQLPSGSQQLNAEQAQVPGTKGTAPQGEMRAQQRGTPPAEGLNVFGVAKGLHQGKVGSLKFELIVDILAIGLIILSVTGVYIAIPLLRGRSRLR